MTNIYFILICLIVISCGKSGLVNHDTYRQKVYLIEKGDTSLVEQNIYYQNKIIEQSKHSNERLLVRDTLIYNGHDQLVMKTRYTDSCKWYATTEYLYKNKKLNYKETNTSKRKVVNTYRYNQNKKLVSDTNTIYDKLNCDDIIYKNSKIYKYQGNEVLEYRYGQHDRLVSWVAKNYNRKGAIIKERYYNGTGIKMYYIINTRNDGLLLQSSKFDGNGNQIENEKYTYFDGKLIKKLILNMGTESTFIYNYEYF